MTNIIELHNVSKRFGGTKGTQALDNLDLTVEEGKIAGFLGPNGAGKSTTIRVILGLLKQDSGTAQVLGLDPFKDAVSIHAELAYVPGDVALWPNLTGGEAIDFFYKLHTRNASFAKSAKSGRSPKAANSVNSTNAQTLDKSTFEANKKDLIDRFDLDPSKKNRTYSKGNRQKVALISALALDTKVLIFDEPTSGLDPLMEAEFQKIVKEKAEQGATVLLSSHILAEVESLADTVQIIRQGHIVKAGTMAEIKAEAGSLNLQEFFVDQYKNTSDAVK